MIDLPPSHHANDALASYLSRHELDAIAQRDASASLAQRQRDARRNAYDALLRDMPLTLALRERGRPPAPHASSAWRPPVMRPHKDARLLGSKGKPAPNEWETQGPHLRTHLAADPSCHHPLVNCSHKW